MRVNISACVVILSLVPVHVLAGPSSSGGATAVVCRDDQGFIQSTELLDVFEAKQDRKREVMQPSGDLSVDYARLVKNSFRLQGYSNKFSIAEAETSLEKFLRMVTWVTLPESIGFVHDQGRTIPMPNYCRLEQLAVASGSYWNPRVQIQREIWERLDSLNKAALIAHELLYFYERYHQESTSETTRSGVRQIISEKGSTPVNEGIEDAHWMCTAVPQFPLTGYPGGNNRTIIYVHRIPNAQGSTDVEFQFVRLAGRVLFTKTVLRIDDFDFQPVNAYGYQGPIVIPAYFSRGLTSVFALDSEHPHWRIRFNYILGQPILLSLIDDQQETESVLTRCEVIGS